MSDEIILFKDTETTGFKKGGPIIQDGQARVCQLALILTDAQGRVLHQFSSLIKPEGWKVSQYNIDKCKITQDDCERFGISAKAAVNLYQRLASMATVIVCHNSEFDQNMMEIEEEYANPGSKKVSTKRYCTMKTNTHITPDGKWPKLEAALLHYTGRVLGEKAHNAIFDTEACRDIFFAMREKKAAAGGAAA